jgi:hypothetical protein
MFARIKLAAALIFALVSPFVSGAAAQSIPPVVADSLSGTHVSLPHDFAGKPAILLVGFTRAGGSECSRFAHRLAREQSLFHGAISVYQIAILDSSPRLLRPVILHAMRSGLSQPEQAGVLPLFHDETQWKQIAAFTKSAENDAYLLLVNPDGSLRWHSHGPDSEALVADFKRHLP